MKDTIYREDAIKAVFQKPAIHGSDGSWYHADDIKDALENAPSADRPQDDDWEKYSDKLWKNAYERGKADGAMIYGNEHNCIMTIFGECSYAETGCGDCAVVEKVRKALSADRPQGEWIIEIDVNGNTYGRCSICGMRQYAGQLNFCPDCGARMKGADDDI